MGERPDRIGIVKGLDIGVLPTSQSEHCSNSILEYMVCGKPVVATNVGGNPELVKDGVTGLLVRPRDPEALAGAIDRLAREQALRSHLGSAGKLVVEGEFLMDVVARRFAGLWVDVCAARRT